MKHEQIFPSKDKGKVKVVCYFNSSRYRDEFSYTIGVEYKPYRGKKWQGLSFDAPTHIDYRNASWREKIEIQAYGLREYVTMEQIQDVLNDLYNKLKPNVFVSWEGDAKEDK